MARYGKGGTRNGHADAPSACRAAKNAASAIAAAVAFAALGLVTGCAAASAAPVPCAPVALSNPAQLAPSKPGDVLLDGLLDCQYANGLMSNCVLIAGASLNDLANAELKGTAVTQ
ncbi:MAG TPA: hypothetical protein VGT04_06995 [Acidobacteriaceae bacterium]|nr:hypothetical protein [Acidobacteriaceae bacterium]